MFRIKYIRIFKHSWVIDNFYNRAYITCLRFLNSLGLLFMVLGWRKNAWFIRISYHAWVQSLQYGQKGSSRTRWIIGYVHIPISWNAEIDKTVLIPVCEIQIHFVCFFSTVIRMSMSSFSLWLFLKLKWTNHSDIERASMNRKEKWWTDKVD